MAPTSSISCGRMFAAGSALLIGLSLGLAGTSVANAAESPIGLGAAASYAVLAGSTVTNTGPSVISGSIGVHGGSEVTGFNPPGVIINGVIHAADTEAAEAKAELTTAYLDAAGRSMTAGVGADLVGQTLVSGVYTGPTLGLTGVLTLDAQGDENAVWVFQAASTLITSSGSTVNLVNGAQACNVFWQIGSSATLGTDSTFVGTVMALTSISAQTGATILGRLLASNGAVTLDTNTITAAGCAPATETSSSSPSSTSSSTPTSSSEVPTSSSEVPTSEGLTPQARAFVPAPFTTPSPTPPARMGIATNSATDTPTSSTTDSSTGTSTPAISTTTGPGADYGQGFGGGAGSGSGNGIDTNTNYLAVTGPNMGPTIGIGFLTVIVGFLLVFAGQRPGRHRYHANLPAHLG